MGHMQQDEKGFVSQCISINSLLNPVNVLPIQKYNHNSSMLNMLLLYYLVDVCPFCYWQRTSFNATEKNDSNHFKLKVFKLQIFTFSLYNLM